MDASMLDIKNNTNTEEKKEANGKENVLNANNYKYELDEWTRKAISCPQLEWLQNIVQTFSCAQ